MFLIFINQFIVVKFKNVKNRSPAVNLPGTPASRTRRLKKQGYTQSILSVSSVNTEIEYANESDQIDESPKI